MRCRSTCLWALTAALTMAGPAAKADDPSAFRDWTAGRQQEALSEWRRLAEAGDPLAQYNLASCYLQGRGVTQSREQAILWLRRSADAGYVKSMELLGSMLMNGNGFRPDYAAARELLSRAADAGSLIAMNNLAALYFQGLGVAVDLPRAHALALAASGGAPSGLLTAIESRMAESLPPVTDGWLAHLASVTKPGDASREWQRQIKLTPSLAKATPLYVDVTLPSGAIVTRILVGGFASRDAARDFCRTLRNADCLAVRHADYH